MSKTKHRKLTAAAALLTAGLSLGVAGVPVASADEVVTPTGDLPPCPGTIFHQGEFYLNPEGGVARLSFLPEWQPMGHLTGSQIPQIDGVNIRTVNMSDGRLTLFYSVTDPEKVKAQPYTLTFRPRDFLYSRPDTTCSYKLQFKGLRKGEVQDYYPTATGYSTPGFLVSSGYGHRIVEAAFTIDNPAKIKGDLELTYNDSLIKPEHTVTVKLNTEGKSYTEPWEEKQKGEWDFDYINVVNDPASNQLKVHVHKLLDGDVNSKDTQSSFGNVTLSFSTSSKFDENETHKEEVRTTIKNTPYSKDDAAFVKLIAERVNDFMTPEDAKKFTLASERLNDWDVVYYGDNARTLTSDAYYWRDAQDLMRKYPVSQMMVTARELYGDNENGPLRNNLLRVRRAWLTTGKDFQEFQAEYWGGIYDLAQNTYLGPESDAHTVVVTLAKPNWKYDTEWFGRVPMIINPEKQLDKYYTRKKETGLFPEIPFSFVMQEGELDKLLTGREVKTQAWEEFDQPEAGAHSTIKLTGNWKRHKAAFWAGGDGGGDYYKVLVLQASPGASFTYDGKTTTTPDPEAKNTANTLVAASDTLLKEPINNDKLIEKVTTAKKRVKRYLDGETPFSDEELASAVTELKTLNSEYESWLAIERNSKAVGGDNDVAVLPPLVDANVGTGPVTGSDASTDTTDLVNTGEVGTDTADLTGGTINGTDISTDTDDLKPPLINAGTNTDPVNTEDKGVGDDTPATTTDTGTNTGTPTTTNEVVGTDPVNGEEVGTDTNDLPGGKDASTSTDDLAPKVDKGINTEGVGTSTKEGKAPAEPTTEKEVKPTTEKGEESTAEKGKVPATEKGVEPTTKATDTPATNEGKKSASRPSGEDNTNKAGNTSKEGNSANTVKSGAQTLAHTGAKSELPLLLSLLSVLSGSSVLALRRKYHK